MQEIFGELTNANILTGLIMGGSWLWMILIFRVFPRAQKLHIPSSKNDCLVNRR